MKVAIGIHGVDFKKIDVYAYAMIIYQVWTGKKPWEEFSSEEIEDLVLSNKRPDMSKNEMETLIRKCWDNFPDKRPNFSEILKDLSIKFC